MFRLGVRAFLVWLVIILAETIHGIFRGLFIVPLIGDLPSRQIGVLVGSVLIFIIALIFIRWLKADTFRDLIFVGIIWVILTVTFEIVLGRFVMGAAWERILSDYNISEGGFMIFGLTFMLFSPYLAHRLRKLSIKTI